MDCPNKPTLEQLQQMDEAIRAENERKALALKLGICPCCGAKLVQEPIEKLDKPKRYLFNLILINFTRWDYRLVCPTDKRHYEDKYDYEAYSGEMC